MTTTIISNASNPADIASMFWLPATIQKALRFQPVFDADGRVVEYALRSTTPSPFEMPQAFSSLSHAISFFENQQKIVRFSLDRSFHGRTAQMDTQRLAAEVSQARTLVDRMHGDKSIRRSTAAEYPNDMITFTLPWINHQGDFGQVIKLFLDFDVHVRAHVIPHFSHGVRSDYSELQMTGVRVRLPEPIADSRPLQSRFLKFLDLARSREIDVLVGDLNDMSDFDWLRAQPGLLFQGNMLSVPLSGELLETWWTQQPDWHRFSFGSEAVSSNWSQHFG